MEGRVGGILVNGCEVGVVGEVNPAVLETWKLENPVAAFELHFQTLADAKLKKQQSARPSQQQRSLQLSL